MRSVGEHTNPQYQEPSSFNSSYETGTKSTKGASKMRRDSINYEINRLRDLLPIPSSARQRLSQLQLMALILVYVRKTNYFEKMYKSLGLGAKERQEITNFGFAKALNGFLIMITQTGRLLYISENAAEYLGHSMEDLLIHGDSIYDIVDKQDHPTIHSQLSREEEEIEHGHKRRNQTFLCRINVSRNARRQMRFGDQKVILVKGHFYGDLPLCSRDEPVFVAWCTPLAMPENREIVVQGATNVFTTVHSMDMKIVDMDDNGETHLGYLRKDLIGVSFYHLLHPDSMRELQAKHRLVSGTESDKSAILLLRLLRENGTFAWCHTVLQVKDNTEESQNPIILCTNQILSSTEAEVMRANSWLYHYYMVQSRLQYGLAYGTTHPASPGLAAYYPQVLGATAATHQPQPFYDHTHHSLSQAYLGHSSSSFTPSSGLYSSYLYNHPAPTYHLPASTTDHTLHNLSTGSTKDFFQGPLDFSKDYHSRDYSVRGAEYSSQQSSPSLGSDTSSSPVYQPPHDSLYGADVALLSHARYSAHLGEHNFKPVLDTSRDHLASAVKQGMVPPAPLLWNESEMSSYERYKNLECENVDRIVKKETTDNSHPSDTNNNEYYNNLR